MKNLTDEQCSALLQQYDIRPTPNCSKQMMFELLRTAFHLGLHAEVMKTRVKEESHANPGRL